jgi:hypothetical protein
MFHGFGHHLLLQRAICSSASDSDMETVSETNEAVCCISMQARIRIVPPPGL